MMQFKFYLFSEAEIGYNVFNCNINIYCDRGYSKTRGGHNDWLQGERIESMVIIQS